MDDSKEINVIIAGSRNFNNYEVLEAVCDRLLERRVLDGYKITIISGGAEGADKLGELYAKNRGYEVKVFEPDWKKYGKRAGGIRNGKMAEVGNALIAFPLGESRGTRDMIKKATEKHLIVREITEEYQNIIQTEINHDRLN